MLRHLFAVAGPLAVLLWSQQSATREFEYCFPQVHAALDGVHLDDPMDSVLIRLGQPLSRRTRHPPPEDPEGFLMIELTYAHLQVDIGRGRRVERLATMSPDVRMPNGIRVGMSLTEVTRRLGLADSLDELRKATWNPPLCEGPLDVAVYTPDITFAWTPQPGPFESIRPAHGRRRVAKIELASYGP